MIRLLSMIISIALSVVVAVAQSSPGEANNPAASPAKKANERPVDQAPAEPFARADVPAMAAQCVVLETSMGSIGLEMFPESAPETVRNFLNLAALGIFDTTTFSRIVPGFIIQGGNIGTREDRTAEQTARARRKIPDEPNLVKHVRGIVSMARPDEPNGASSSFFILVGDGSHLDGTFAAFGRVTSGMDVVDQINGMEVDGDKPKDPAKLLKAIVSRCGG